MDIVKLGHLYSWQKKIQETNGLWNCVLNQA